ncbi:MAG: hypothetical protein ACKOJI_02770, partial [Phycisphaerales bacterium]
MDALFQLSYRPAGDARGHGAGAWKNEGIYRNGHAAARCVHADATRMRCRITRAAGAARRASL